ncbi:MAG: hypothetical protein AAGB12_02740 [Pseudomonadota bacterium]
MLNKYFYLDDLDIELLEKDYLSNGFSLIKADEVNGNLSLKLIENFNDGVKLSGLKSLPNAFQGFWWHFRSHFWFPKTQDVFSFYLMQSPHYSYKIIEDGSYYFMFETKPNQERLKCFKSYV